MTAIGAFLTLCLALLAAGVPSAQTVTYEAYAVRFGTLPQFRVAGLVAGADQSRRMDIPVMVWLLKGSNGRRVLVDSGFHRQKFIDQWKVVDFRTPADAVAAAGVKAEEITDIIISHAHWDHVGGVDLFPKATIWIQRDEYAYYTGDAWHARNTHGGIDDDDMLALVRINTEGRLRFVDGDDEERSPASAATPAASTPGRPSTSAFRRRQAPRSSPQTTCTCTRTSRSVRRLRRRSTPRRISRRRTGSGRWPPSRR